MTMSPPYQDHPGRLLVIMGLYETCKIIHAKELGETFMHSISNVINGYESYTSIGT